MRFLFADSLDYVDPTYRFEEDRFGPEREAYWTDQFPHEALGYAPYDGMLVSRGIVGGQVVAGKYSDAQAQRFRRVGAREFLRFREDRYPNSWVFGDSGAFTYHTMEEPPYSTEDIVDFYGDGQFTHACSIDHIIFDFVDDDRAADLDADQLARNQKRFDVTLTNAEEFLSQSRRLGNRFTPIGVAQGWSPSSLARAAQELERMGYDYIAVGGMAPLRSPEIKKALTHIRRSITASTRLHVLGFAKAEQIHEFTGFGITSFDSSSPLIRAFKDARSNYYLPLEGGGLAYYSAIRVPQAIENNKLKSLAKEGVYQQENLQEREQAAMRALRFFDQGQIEVEEALDTVMAYAAPILIGRDEAHSERDQKRLDQTREQYARTLRDRPWRSCSCSICAAVGIEVVIFRASNRNKRRGIHNLHVYRGHLNRTLGTKIDVIEADIHCYSRPAE
ncbi:tRNA-guanine transglycosylase DpdA [Thalassobaculum sp.]|uniref:tRNA-guanine transglycosylase DpdA n=1 Tax=Thalassobaculum sp. TaxID=2022740 RepID=UPI003B5AEE2E